MTTGKKTVIIGATTNPARYAYFVAERLVDKGHDIVPVGIKKGEVLTKPILDLRTTPEIEDVDTVTLYLNPTNQTQWEDYILSIAPKRIIFNPGTENFSLMKRAEEKGIEAIAACTLSMLSVGQY